jgi:hypothetical protein
MNEERSGYWLWQKEHIIHIQFSNDYVRTPENLENKVEINKYYRTAWTKKNSDVSIPTVEKLPTNATSKLIIFLKVYNASLLFYIS